MSKLKNNTTITLYSYWRSSAAYRVRIALNLKGLTYQTRPVHLVKNGGEQHSDDYHQINPNELVPVLVDGDIVLNQSLAIIDYLDDTYTVQPLLTPHGHQRYITKALAQDIAVDIHPINNLRVVQYLCGELNINDEQSQRWYSHWIEIGFRAIESRLKQTSGKYSVGDNISIADVCLIPQVYNAHRFHIDMSPFPIISAIYDRCNQLSAFIDAQPENQPDAD